MVARHIIFIGWVQGVGFRFTTHRMANRHQLTGFVRNLSNGSVDMLAQGMADDIDDCIQDIKEYYPGHIRKMKIEEIPPDPQHIDFRIAF